MNYLAHLHIADHCNSHFAGNLLGDFVKGCPEQQHPQPVADGIRLHRFVDVYTDSHLLVKQAKSYFHPDRKRYALIALDMFWDHCLAKDWRHYSDESLAEFSARAERQVLAYQGDFSPRYQRLMSFMWQQQWLQSYAKFDNIALALERMSRRSERMTPLAECSQDLQQYYEEVSQLFAPFYQDLLAAAKQQG